MGLAGRLLFRHLHHEECDLRVLPSDPWDAPNKDAMQGNAALPYLYFSVGGHLEKMGVPLRVIERTPFASLPWILTGGFQPTINLLTEGLVSTIEIIDRVVSLVAPITATRCFLVLERVGI